MAELAYAQGYEDLVVYQKSFQLASRVFEVSKMFPREEMYSLTSQIRDSSRSVGAQIAEAWAKRKYEKHFASKLTDADGEQQETQHWLRVASDCKYLDDRTRDNLMGLCAEIGRMLGSMIAKSADFCCPRLSALRESSSEYFFASPDS